MAFPFYYLQKKRVPELNFICYISIFRRSQSPGNNVLSITLVVFALSFNINTNINTNSSNNKPRSRSYSSCIIIHTLTPIG